MININDIELETGLKIISGLTALIALIQRIWEGFSNLKKKQALKIDLEILDLAKKLETLDFDLIEKNLSDRMSKMYIDTSAKIDNFRNFLIGMVLFLGFSWWSIDMFGDQKVFNPWIILTGFMSAIGLALMFDRDRNKGKKSSSDSPFFVFEISKKSDFVLGFVIFTIFGLISWAILLKSSGFSFWIVLTGAFTLLGLGMIISEMSIKIKK